MKTLIFLTSIAAAEAALPLKNFPGNKRRLVKFDPTTATVTDCSFSTLGDLLPDDTVEYAIFDTVKDKGYIGGVATRIQLSGKNGYNYYMRGSGESLFKKFQTTFSYVQCHEIEDGEFDPDERTNNAGKIEAAHCGMKDSGIRKLSTNTNDVTGGDNGKNGIDMKLETNDALFKGYSVDGGICKSDFVMKASDDSTHQVIARSSCDAISGKPTIPDATYANGISIVTKVCGVDADSGGDFSGTGCIVTIGEETIDIAIASKCGANGGRHQRAIGDVSEAFVWYRTTRPAVKYTIKSNDDDFGQVVSIDANGQQVNNWIGDILFTRPPHINPATDFAGSDEDVFVNPSYVKRADSFVTFASNPTNVQTGATAGGTPGDTATSYDGLYTNRCSVADPGTYNSINDFTGSQNAITAGRWNCKAKLEATVTLVNKFVGACTPGAFLKSSLVQFARIHKTHMEVGTNVTKFASTNSMVHETLGYHNRFNGAAEKYALIAMNQTTLANGESKTSEWQCETDDKCEKGNPFVLLQYNEDAGIWTTNLNSDGEFTVQTDSGFRNLIDPGTVFKDAAGEQNLAAIAYTYVIGYVDFGYGCFKTTTTAANLVDEAKTRRLAVEPEEWEVHSQITFAGGHHIDID